MTTATRPLPSIDAPAYQRWVRRQKGYGRWQPFTDAEPVRNHVRTVMATTGIGWRRYADLAGVPRTTVTYLLYGRQGQLAARVSPDNARKLLTVNASRASGVTIPATGTHRRIQALTVEGWPQVHLAPFIRTHRAYVSCILTLDRVTAATAGRVADAYEHLRGKNPLDHGVTAHGVLLATRMAAHNQWLDRGYWDDVDRIDDPDFDPGAKQLRIDQVGEDATWLKQAGLCIDQIAHRLGISRDYVEKGLRHAAQSAQAAA
ncbi:hypothetical protein ACIO6U_02940 [Streptomyces sp. NPDC087422]|uniref:hypothetical protein n=1 Tax=Streptomyces sp. NPDC087422 TaxID=3365786 RepID=UPI00380F4313